MNPWPPLYKKNPDSVLSILAMTVGLLLAVVRVPLFIVLLLLGGLASIVITPLCVIPFLGRFLQVLIERLIAGLIMLIMGFFFTTENYSKQANRTRVVGIKDSDAIPISGGDIIISNWTGYADIVYLTFKYSPVFAFPSVSQGATDYMVCSRGFFGAMLHSMGHKQQDVNGCESLSKTIKRARGYGQPVVVFAEAEKTNGLCVITMQAFSLGLGDSFSGHIHLSAFKHKFHFGALPFTAGSFLMHLFHVSRQMYSGFTVRYMNPRCVPTLDLKASRTDAEAWAGACRDTVSRWAGLKAVKSAADEKADFLVFFNTGAKSRKSRVGQGGRSIATDTGKPTGMKVDAAILREQRLAAKRAKEDSEDIKLAGSDSDE